LDKHVCIDKVGDLIGNTFHKVDLSNPEYVVLIEVFKVRANMGLYNGTVANLTRRTRVV